MISQYPTQPTSNKELLLLHEECYLGLRELIEKQPEEKRAALLSDLERSFQVGQTNLAKL